MFPNLQILPGLNWLRVYHPKGPAKVEQWTWAMVEKDMPDEVKTMILDNQCLTFGTAGLFDNDNGDNLAACTEQSRGWRTAQMDLYTHMALGRSDSARVFRVTSPPASSASRTSATSIGAGRNSPAPPAGMMCRAITSTL